MEICESKQNTPHQEKTTETTNKKEPNLINESNNITEANKNTNGDIECMHQSSPLEKIDSNISNVAKSICKIKIETPKGTKLDTGFLLRFYIDQEAFYCLISNEHVITKDIINNKNNIFISYDSGFRGADIRLDSNKRYNILKVS